MVSASFIVSALFALTVAVSAAPALLGGPLAKIDGGDHIGTEEIILEDMANGILTVDGLEVHDNVQNPHILK